MVLAYRWIVALSVMGVGCGPSGDPLRRPPYLSQELEGCFTATPLVVESRGERFLLVTGGRGRMSALDFETGDEAWSVVLPVSEELMPFTEHWVAALDLEAREVHRRCTRSSPRQGRRPIAKLLSCVAP